MFNSLKLMSWNIQGLTNNVISDDYFITCIESNDIIVLTETWLSDQIEIAPEKYYNFHNIRPMHARARRPSGGISVLIKHDLRRSKSKMGISVIKETDCLVWLKIHSSTFGLSSDLYICACYLPPENSSYWKHHDFDPFSSLEQDICDFRNNGTIIITGDLNARTGIKPDYLPDCNDLGNPDSIVLSSYNTVLDKLGRKHRKSEDKISNSYGNKLLTLCQTLNLRILNGRTLGDLNGNYTCFQHNGRSVVDYLISDEHIINLISTMTISQPTHLSDHAHLNCNINVGLLHQKLTYKKTEQEGKRDYKWDKKSDIAFKNSLKLPLIKEKLSELSKVPQGMDQAHINEYCSKLINIFNIASKISLKIKKGKNTTKRHILGFDGDCKKQKKHVLHLGKLATKYPSDPLIYGKFLSEKKKFKKLVKIKKREAKKALLDDIMKFEKKDPKEFWKLVNKLKNKKSEIQNPISINNWSSYFTKLHNNKNTNIDREFDARIKEKLKLKIKQQTDDPIFDCKFTSNEIYDSIKCLKLNKASGLDAIKNEMIKSSCETLLPFYCELFNKLLKSECYPEQWTKGYIVPLYKTSDKNDPSNYRGITISSCLGKLFSILINNRLKKFLDDNNIISKYQIGFCANKRTSDHIFVLKCLIEEAKSKKSRIYSCFIDLRKAFDTVWIEGLLYKLVCKYNVSPKLCRLLKCMYDNLKAQVYTNGELGYLFNISIGTRQGCNLSPTLFNLFINDLPSILSKTDCDPVTLHSEKINILMYADDMVLLSKSKKGLEKSLKIVEIYCKKWHLSINTDKTKIMIFNCNKYHDMTFKINGKTLQVVKSYNYLGVQITSSGLFTSAIKELSAKANRAYLSIANIFRDNPKMPPYMMIKLFDSLIKPIVTYSSEVWGAFGHKKRQSIEFLDGLFKNLKSPYEQLHLKFCKRALGTSRRSSNIGSLAELGRYPIMYNIICAICKYRIRLQSFKKGDLLYHAWKSQQSLKHNNGVTFTYDDFTNRLFEKLNIDNIMPPICNVSGENIKDTLKRLSKPIYRACRGKYEDFFFKSLNNMKNDGHTKLTFFIELKTSYTYESYLKSDYHRHITKFRLSDHNLPIERGRYAKPKLPRELRICPKCKAAIGNELHALFQCQEPHLKDINMHHINKILNISDQISNLPDACKLLYLLKASDNDVNHIFAKWLEQVNNLYKP